MKWLDYSLLVIKANWALFGIDNGMDELTYLENLFINPLYYVRSQKEPGIYYHIAIIDYLQEWNIQKISESNYKKIKNKKFNADISAVDPITYANRF